MMKKPPSFRRFLLIMVFVLEGLSLAAVIGFLFAMLDQSMQKEQVSRINVQQAELRLYLTDRLNYTYNRVKEIRFNNNIKIALLLGMHGKIAENIQTLYPKTMGSAFYVRSADGHYFPQPDNSHEFLNDPNFIPLGAAAEIQKTASPHTFVYAIPIIQQNQIKGHAVGIYDPSKDLRFSTHLRITDHDIVYKQNEHLVNLFTHRPLPVPVHRTTEELTQKQYRRTSDECLTLGIGMQELPALYLIVDNQPYRKQRWSMVTYLALLCIPLLGLTFSVSFLILKRVSSALDNLSKNALHIAQSDEHLDLDTANIRYVEFLHLARAFNKVMATVHQRTGDLKNANENLKTQNKKRRQMAEALQESEAQLRSLQDNIPIGLFRRTIHGELLFANPKMISIFGYDSEDEMLQVPIRQLYHDPEQYDQVTHQFENSNDIQSLALRYQRKDGTPIWGAVHLKRTADPKSGEVYIDGAFIDISDRKTIEDEKNKLEKQLRQVRKMEALGTLAGGIAHDFNNILYAIIGYCELALEDATEDTIQQENLDQAIAGARRAAELVEQILTFARQTDIKKHPLNLTAIVKESLKLIRATIPASIEIQTQLDDRLKILADPTQMHQIIVNLCTNAGHAMQDTGGVLTIELEEVDISSDKALCQTELKAGRYALLKFGDTGHGMSVATMERIFDPYYTTKEQGEGSGMGLSVVQGIIHSLSGAIRVDSIIGRGSTFRIYLPALDEMGADGEKPHQQDHCPSGGKEHILLVDDELPITRMMTQMLCNMGYHVTPFNNPVTALEQFRHAPEKFDLVISDVTMPHMAGPDMAREMIKIRPDLPVLLCTGYDTTITREKAENIGARALIHKPLVRKELSTTIRSVLGANEHSGSETHPN